MKRSGAVPTGLRRIVGLASPTLKRGANKRCAYGAGFGVFRREPAKGERRCRRQEERGPGIGEKRLVPSCGVEARAIPGLKSKTWGTHYSWWVERGGSGGVKTGTSGLRDFGTLGLRDPSTSLRTRSGASGLSETWISGNG